MGDKNIFQKVRINKGNLTEIIFEQIHDEITTEHRLSMIFSFSKIPTILGKFESPFGPLDQKLFRIPNNQASIIGFFTKNSS